MDEPHHAEVGALGCAWRVRSSAASLASARRTRSSRSPARQQAGQIIVRVELKEPLAALPAASRSPARRASRSTSRASATAWANAARRSSEGNLRSVNVAQAGERTRLVLNLRNMAQLRRAGRGQGAAWSRSTVAAPAAPASGGRRGAASPKARPTATHCADATSTSAAARDGAGRVVVDLSDAPRSASTSASRARAWWSSSCEPALPDNLRRRLDVTDFGTPVQTVATFQQGDHVRMVVEPRGLVGAQRLPDRQPVRARSAAGEGRPEQADAGRAGLRRARSCRSTSRTSKCVRCCR